jgi:hypothetical protein
MLGLVCAGHAPHMIVSDESELILHVSALSWSLWKQYSLLHLL